VKRVLFDENLPRLLRRELPEFEVRTVQEEGWGSFRNGDLLRKAADTFDVLLTADRRMQYQQKLTTFQIGGEESAYHETLDMAAGTNVQCSARSGMGA
jgi:hypothetical protein